MAHGGVGEHPTLKYPTDHCIEYTARLALRVRQRVPQSAHSSNPETNRLHFTRVWMTGHIVATTDPFYSTFSRSEVSSSASTPLSTIFSPNRQVSAACHRRSPRPPRSDPREAVLLVMREGLYARD